MDTLALWLTSPALVDWYLMFCMGVMIGPLIGLAFWYHSNIGKSEGGRALMKRQNENVPHKFNPKLGEGLSMARDVASGAYGEHAGAMQRKVYLFCGLWLVACVICFGLLIYGQSLQQTADSAAQPAPAATRDGQ